MKKKVVVLGDLHFPFHHKAAVTKVVEFIEENKPDVVIQVGDLFDFYSLSRFPRTQAIPPHVEISEARQCAENLWSIIRLKSPKSKCFQLYGNHDSRMRSRVMERLPEIIDILRFEDLFTFKGVKTIHSERTEFMIDDVCFMHGYRSGSPEKAPHARANLVSTVCGHSHRGGAVFVGIKPGKMIYELNAGYLADPNASAMSYTKQSWTGWTLGFGYIDQYGPRFIPYVEKKK